MAEKDKVSKALNEIIEELGDTAKRVKAINSPELVGTLKMSNLAMMTIQTTQLTRIADSLEDIHEFLVRRG